MFQIEIIFRFLFFHTKSFRLLHDFIRLTRESRIQCEWDFCGGKMQLDIIKFCNTEQFKNFFLLLTLYLREAQKKCFYYNKKRTEIISSSERFYASLQYNAIG